MARGAAGTLAMCLGSIVALAALSGGAAGSDLALPHQTLEISAGIEIGDLENRLELDLVVSPVLDLRDGEIGVVLSEPALYARLIGAFKSRDESGCSVVYRRPEAKDAFEVRVCEIRNLSVYFDKQTRVGHLRVLARMRSGPPGRLGEPVEHVLALQFAIAFEEGSIVLHPSWLAVGGLPREVDAPLLRASGDFSFPLHSCLERRALAIEDLRLVEGANEARLQASASGEDLVRIRECFLPYDVSRVELRATGHEHIRAVDSEKGDPRASENAATRNDPRLAVARHPSGPERARTRREPSRANGEGLGADRDR